MNRFIRSVLVLFSALQVSYVAGRTREPKEPVTSKVLNCSRGKKFVCEIKPNANYTYTERVCHCEPN